MMTATPSRRVALGETGTLVKDNIRYCRMKRELTQAQLADLAALPTQAITEIENGARRVSVDDLTAIARALKVSNARLLGNK
jgi:transcriptional regulator with XRE-family HTH domain